MLTRNLVKKIYENNMKDSNDDFSKLMTDVWNNTSRSVSYLFFIINFKIKIIWDQ